MWTRTETGWEAALPQPFPDEATLQSLIMETPQLLPLEGAPSLAVLGSSVRLGDEQAGIFAVESTGRPTIIETSVSNPESRGSILAQAFSFAAFLKGSTVRSLETGALRQHLKDRGYRSIREAAQAQTSPDAVDETFGTSLKGFLNRGDFRFVMVLDEVPERLNRITAYLDEMTEQALTIDLIVIKVHEENGTQIATPQRITPGA